jgi:hypothetical protein
VDFSDNYFTLVTFGGKVAFEAAADPFNKAGAVGVWDKGRQLVTLFDDLAYGSK